MAGLAYPGEEVLDDADDEALVGAGRRQEVSKAQVSARGWSPGEFYEAAWDVVGETLTEVLNAV